MPKQTFLCTRPLLASQLIEAGYKGEPTTNVFHPEMRAWEFPLSTSLAFDVARFYDSIRKPAPKAIREYLRKEAPVTSAEYLS